MASDQVKLGDFGIARVIQCTEDFASTMVGTPYYLSPEIIRDQPYDYKSDVWALGIVLFEMASLQHPFNADQLTVLAARILQDDVPSIDSTYSQQLFLLITDMLKKEPQLRPTVHDVLSLKYLQPAMKTANDTFKLGIDLSEFAPKKNAPDEKVLSPRTTGAESGNGTCEETAFASDSENEHENSTAKSVAQLKLSDGAHSSPSEVHSGFSSKATALRCYLKENTSTDEFQQVYALTRETAGKIDGDLASATEDARRQAKDILGPERASLLPMFQLLGFFRGCVDQPSWEEQRWSAAIVGELQTKRSDPRHIQKVGFESGRRHQQI
jgi:serine/threonine protein kinase